MPTLHARPSAEYLRKQAKRTARARSIALADAQRFVASEHGFRTWADMMRHVASVRGEAIAVPPLLAAVRLGDLAAVRELLDQGVNPRIGDGRETPLHVAARRGPYALVETLIVGGALEWLADEAGRTPLEVARRGRARDRAAIIALLDRGAITDPSFRAAVGAIHSGDGASLARLLDAEPRLLRERILGPEPYRRAKRHQYFRDPKLFWFVANNPTIVERLPANIADIARIMIERGVDRADLDYALDLTMSSCSAREDGVQRTLMEALLAAGARATRETIEVCAAHRELEALAALLQFGEPMSAPIAAALGDLGALRDCLPVASRADLQSAFGLAVINANVEATRLTLAAGADVNAFLPVHAHSTALHDAAGRDDVALIDLLLAHGARTDAHDKLWDGTPLGWAMHAGNSAAQAALEAHAAGKRPGFGPER
jgi:Ankyrin repeats (3 copies)